MGWTRKSNLRPKFDTTKAFKKDWRRLSHSGVLNMNSLKEAMTVLVAKMGRFLRNIRITRCMEIGFSNEGERHSFAIAERYPLRYIRRPMIRRYAGL